MEEKGYLDGFALYGPEPISSRYFAGKELVVHLDNKDDDVINFKDERHVTINGEKSWEYCAQELKMGLYLVTVNMLEVDRYNIYVIDTNNALVTANHCEVTTIEKGSSPMSDTNNLVVRDICFGYYGDTDPLYRHHYTHELVDYILETEGNPGDVCRWFIHSDTKISYYQKEWLITGNPIDKDGVGMGEARYVKITDDVFIITLIKHSHGNQPFFVWDRSNGRYVANWSGVSRRSLKKFVTTGGGFMRRIHL